MKRFLLWLVAATLLLNTVNAQKKVVFTPQWTAQAQFVGFYVANNMGFYKDAGLDVTIKHPSA